MQDDVKTLAAALDKERALEEELRKELKKLGATELAKRLSMCQERQRDLEARRHALEHKRQSEVRTRHRNQI